MRADFELFGRRLRTRTRILLLFLSFLLLLLLLRTFLFRCLLRFRRCLIRVAVIILFLKKASIFF